MSDLRNMRLNARLTQKEVALHMGYDTPQYISNNERGVSFFPVKSFKKLAKLYKVSADLIFSIYADRELLKLSKRLEKELAGMK